MTKEEKYAGAILALKMIAKTQPKKNWIETSYMNGHNEDCKQCRKMIDMATSALEELVEGFKDD